MTFFSIIIFIITLIFYLHIFYHLKTNSNLEVFVTDYISKEKCTELCDLKQPAIFSYSNKILSNKIIDSIHNKNFNNIKLNVHNTNHDDCKIPLSLEKTTNLMKKDKTALYTCERNSTFMEVTGLNTIINDNDNYFKPYLVSSKNYDIVFGADKAHTKVRCDVNFRNFYYCVKGNFNIKIMPPSSTDYLNKKKNMISYL